MKKNVKIKSGIRGGGFKWKLSDYTKWHFSDGALGIKKHFKKGIAILSGKFGLT